MIEFGNSVELESVYEREDQHAVDQHDQPERVEHSAPRGEG